MQEETRNSYVKRLYEAREKKAPIPNENCNF